MQKKPREILHELFFHCVLRKIFTSKDYLSVPDLFTRFCRKEGFIILMVDADIQWQQIVIK